MTSHKVSETPLSVLHNLWVASLAGPPSAMLSSQKSLLNTILARSPSALTDAMSTCVLVNIALLHAFHGSLKLAITSFKEAIAHSPYCALAHYGLGVAWFLQAHNIDAIEAWEACMSCFGLAVPEDSKGGASDGINEIRYQFWKPSWHGEEQHSHRGQGAKNRDNQYQLDWFLHKKAVLWNLHVATRSRQTNMDAVYCPGKRTKPNNDLDVLFVNGIPAGMLFGPPFELPKEVQERGRYRGGLGEKTYFNHPFTNAAGHVPTGAASFLPGTQLAPNAVPEYKPKTSSKENQDTETSITSSLTATRDHRPLPTPQDRGLLASRPSHVAPHFAHPDHRANAATSQPAASNGTRNNQVTDLASSHDNQHRSRSRTLDDAAPSNTLGMRKPLPPLPDGLAVQPNITSRSYTVPLQQERSSGLTVPRAPSTNPLSISRFFSKSKRGNIGAGTSSNALTHTGVHTPLGENTRSKEKVIAPKRPDRSAEEFSVQDLRGDQLPNHVSAEAAMEAGSIHIDISGKTEWEKRMEQSVAAEMEIPKRLYFPREEINRKHDVVAGYGLGLGFLSRESNAITTIPTQIQSRSLPAPVPIPQPMPLTITESDDRGSRGSSRSREGWDYALILNEHDISSVGAANSIPGSNSRSKHVPNSNPAANCPTSRAASSLPVFPPRTSSLLAPGPSSPPPSCPLPPLPPQQQRRGRGRSRLGLELELNDVEEDFMFKGKGKEILKDRSISRTRTQHQNEIRERFNLSGVSGINLCREDQNEGLGRVQLPDMTRISISHGEQNQRQEQVNLADTTGITIQQEDQNERCGRANLSDMTAITTPQERRSRSPFDQLATRYTSRNQSCIREYNAEHINHTHSIGNPARLENQEKIDQKSGLSIHAPLQNSEGSEGYLGTDSVSVATAALAGAEELLGRRRGAAHDSVSDGRSEGKTRKEPEPVLLLKPTTYEGFGPGISGRWNGGGWV